jgi:CBS domain-containing protein
MRKVADVLSRKGSSAISVLPDQTVIDALKIMAEKNIGSVIVKDESGQYMGIVTERDYSRKIVLHGRSSTETKVQEIMSTEQPRVSPHDTLEYCMEQMSDKNVRYLPVFSGDELRGIISMSDIVKETIIAQQETIDHLKHYITL